MVSGLLPLRQQPPGVAALVEQIAVGVAIYAMIVAILDIAGIRTILIARVRPMLTLPDQVESRD